MQWCFVHFYNLFIVLSPAYKTARNFPSNLRIDYTNLTHCITCQLIRVFVIRFATLMALNDDIGHRFPLICTLQLHLFTHVRV